MLQIKYSLNMDWNFIKKDIADAYQVECSTEEWKKVSLPHTYNDTDTFDNFMEGGHNGERSMFTGKTWYRKELFLDQSWENKKLYIEFEGVRQAADFYVNGKKLAGKNETGFIAFGYDVTDFVHFGDRPNVLAVMVDNSFPYYAEGTDAILSWHDSHWHPTHGGIYRNVNLYVKDKLHTTLPLYSYTQTQGVYVYNENITEDTAEIVVEAEIKNDYADAQEADVHVSVKDRNGEVVLTFSKAIRMASGTKEVASLSSTLENVQRWSPEYPYLYEVEVAIKQEGVVIDTQIINHGIRTFEFTNNQGFFINGNQLKLHGWGQRPTNEWAGVGTAYPDWMHDYVLALMKDAGGNFIRWGHSAGAPADIDASDRLGLVAVQPGVDGEGSTIGGVYSPDSYKVRIKAFRDLIIYFRNHPSILVWEAGNQSVPVDEAIAMRELTDRWDPKGQRWLAYRRLSADIVPYADLSIGTEGSWEMRSKGLPVIEGEYNREEAARRVWDRHTPGYENYHTAAGSAYDLTSEELAKNQAKHYRKISIPAHGGGANWIFSDSTSHGRVYSEVSRVSGQVDGVMLPKESYFATKAIFHNEPQVHIIGHWNYPEGTVKDIYVMSNSEQIELFLNGVSLGTGKQSDAHLFTFKDVVWQAGQLKAVGYDKDGKAIVSQIKETTGKAEALRLTTIHSPSGLLANGADYVHIDVEAVDREGRRVPTFEGKVSFKLTGPAVWRGGYNSGLEDSTNNDYLYLEAGINRVAVRTTLSPGSIELTGKAEGIAAASIQIDSLQVPFKNGLTTHYEKIQNLLNKNPGIGEGPKQNHELEELEDESHFIITDFSYSGIHEIGKINRHLFNGDLAFADEEFEFRFLPERFYGAEAVQLPNADKNYKALDLIHLTINKDADVYVAHDLLLATPEWLSADYERTEAKIILNRRGHELYKKTVRAGTTLTMGGNLDEENTEEGNMFLLFVTEQAADTDEITDFFSDKEIDWHNLPKWQ